MTNGAFEKTNWGWQIDKFSQRLGEWIELQLSRFNLKLPENQPAPDWDFNSPWLRVLFWVLVSLLVGWLGWQLSKNWPEFRQFLLKLLPRQVKLDTKKEPVLSSAVLRNKALQLYRQGRFSEASRLLYLALLQRLHEQNLIENLPSRTDGEYRKLFVDAHQENYQVLLSVHERQCFGDIPASDADFQACQKAFDKTSSNS